MGLDKHPLSSDTHHDATGQASSTNLPAGATSPTLTASRVAHVQRNSSGSPILTSLSGHIPFPSSPTYLRSSSTSKGMKHFPTFRAEPSFRHHPGGMGAIIRDPIEVLERDEVGLIDQLVEEESLPWSEDGEEEEGEEGAKLKKNGSVESYEGIPISLVRNQTLGSNGISNDNTNGNTHGSLRQCGGIAEGDEDASDDDDSLNYSRSPDSVSDDGLESNTGQHVMDGVMVAHSNSLRSQHSTRRFSFDVMEAALSSTRTYSDRDNNGTHEGHTTTDPLRTTSTTRTNPTGSTYSGNPKFIGNTPTRPLGSHRSGPGISHKSTDSIDEALRLHALSLNNTPKPPPPFGGGGSGGGAVGSQPPIHEEEREEETDEADTNSSSTKGQLSSTLTSSSSSSSTWHKMPFTVRNAPLLRVIPKFYGVTQADDRTLLELEDLARWYRHPCIMDIKVGYKTWYSHAEPEYIDRCKRKDAVTTQASLGFKICGLQVYRHARGGYWRASKRWCKTLPEALVDKALASFANNEHGLRPVDVYGGDQGVVAQLRALESWFQVQNEFHLYSSSLLFLYEGDAHGPEETNVRVRLVDFAHTFAVGGDSDSSTCEENKSDFNGGSGGGDVATHKMDPERKIDENFLGGLRAIASRLNAVSTMEYVADTLMTTAAV